MVIMSGSHSLTVLSVTFEDSMLSRLQVILECRTAVCLAVSNCDLSHVPLRNEAWVQYPYPANQELELVFLLLFQGVSPYTATCTSE